MTIPPQIGAGIDIGSHTFRLLVATCHGTKLTVLARDTATVGLGRGLGERGLLQENSMERGLGALQRFRLALERWQPVAVRACGTEALRRAKNSHSFLRQAETLLGVPVEIIDGTEEARLSLAGVLAGGPAPRPGPLLLADVGGGSTELVFAGAATETGTVQTASVNLGVVNLTAEFLAEPKPDRAGLDKRIAAGLTGALRQLGPLVQEKPLTVIGSGGSATSMAALALGLETYDERLVHGFTLEVAAMQQLWQRLAALDPPKRNALPCLGEGRGEILPAGIRIYQAILQLLQQERLRVSDTGLLEGITLSSLSRGQT